MTRPLKKRGLTPVQHAVMIALIVVIVGIAVVLVPLAILRLRDLLR